MLVEFLYFEERERWRARVEADVSVRRPRPTCKYVHIQYVLKCTYTAYYMYFVSGLWWVSRYVGYVFYECIRLHSRYGGYVYNM